jgi:hydrogenase/urease accessory protein HupE
LYGVALALMFVGILLALLRPSVIWLVPEVKGIGGQFYGVMEGFGREIDMTQLLQTLLVIENTETEEDST